MKTIVFIAPTWKWWTYYYYKDITDYLIKNHSDKYNIIFCSSLKDYLLRHFKKADIIFSIIPFFFKPLWAKKYIYNLHWNFKKERKSNNLWSKLLYLSELNLWFCDKILLISYFLADKLWFRDKYKNKIEILPNYVKPVKKSSLKKENDNNFLTITSFSFYDKWKWVVNLWNVIKKYWETHLDINITFSIAWDTNTKYFPKIKEEFDKIKFPKNVKIDWMWWLTKEKMEDEFYKNNTFIYRTELDNAPWTVLEALNYWLNVYTNDFESFKYFIPRKCICWSEEEMLKKIEKVEWNEELNQEFLFENVIIKLIKLFLS